MKIWKTGITKRERIGGTDYAIWYQTGFFSEKRYIITVHSESTGPRYVTSSIPIFTYRSLESAKRAIEFLIKNSKEKITNIKYP